MNPLCSIPRPTQIHGLGTLLVLFYCLMNAPTLTGAQKSAGKHLIIASGQSNAVNFKPQNFKSYLDATLGAQNYILVHRSKGGTSIQAWYKNWTLPESYTDKPKGMVKNPGDIYEALIADVSTSIKGRRIASITFAWMQGEADALGRMSGRYAESLEGVYQQLNTDLRDAITHLKHQHIRFDA